MTNESKLRSRQNGLSEEPIEGSVLPAHHQVQELAFVHWYFEWTHGSDLFAHVAVGHRIKKKLTKGCFALQEAERV